MIEGVVIDYGDEEESAHHNNDQSHDKRLRPASHGYDHVPSKLKVGSSPTG